MINLSECFSDAAVSCLGNGGSLKDRKLKPESTEKQSRSDFMSVTPVNSSHKLIESEEKRCLR